MTTDERLDKLIGLLEKLTPSMRVDVQVCPKNYSGEREHNWQWNGSTYQMGERYAGVNFISDGKPRRDGIYRVCQYCLSEDWNVKELAEIEAGAPQYKNGDKVIFTSQRLKKIDGHYVALDETEEWFGAVTQVYLTGFSGVEWRFELKGEKSGDWRTPTAKDLRMAD